MGTIAPVKALKFCFPPPGTMQRSGIICFANDLIAIIRQTAANPHIVPSVGGTEVYIDWCIRINDLSYIVDKLYIKKKQAFTGKYAFLSVVMAFLQSKRDAININKLHYW